MFKLKIDEDGIQINKATTIALCAGAGLIYLAGKKAGFKVGYKRGFNKGVNNTVIIVDKALPKLDIINQLLKLGVIEKIK